jgi:hypothetical protein
MTQEMTREEFDAALGEIAADAERRLREELESIRRHPVVLHHCTTCLRIAEILWALNFRNHLED